MKFLLFVVALVGLLAQTADAGIFNRQGRVDVQVALAPYTTQECPTVAVAAVPCVRTAQVVVAPPVEVKTVEAQAQVVTYQQGSRKLTLLERSRARREARQAIRDLRIATLEPAQAAFVVANPCCN